MRQGKGLHAGRCRSFPGLAGGGMVELGSPLYLALVIGCIVIKRSASFAWATRRGPQAGYPRCTRSSGRAGSAHHIRREYLPLGTVFGNPDCLAPLELFQRAARAGRQAQLPVRGRTGPGGDPPRARTPSAGIPWLTANAVTVYPSNRTHEPSLSSTESSANFRLNRLTFLTVSTKSCTHVGP